MHGSFGKVFRSIFSGSLYGHWQAIVTMEQLIVLCDAEGVIDMTLEAIAATTSIPLEILRAGIDHLEQPDPFSRTSGEGGRRLARLSETRPWGWRIVNHGLYRNIASSERKREADAARQRLHREAIANAAPSLPSLCVTPGHAASRMSRHAEAEAEAEAQAGPVPSPAAPFVVRSMRPLGTPAIAGEPAALPLSDRRSEAVLSLAMVSELLKLYPAVNVDFQIGEMRGWLLSNPANRKTRSGLMRFVTGWLAREQNSARITSAHPDRFSGEPRPTRRADATYLRKDREERNGH